MAALGEGAGLVEQHRGISADEVLRLAGGVELDSEHPLARAIVAAAR